MSCPSIFPQVAYATVVIALLLASLPASFAASGDTWTADLIGTTLPPGSTLVKVCLPLASRPLFLLLSKNSLLLPSIVVSHTLIQSQKSFINILTIFAG
jgi:hypothetical protein